MDITAVAVAAGSAIASFAALKTKHDALEKEVKELKDEFGKLDERFMARDLLEEKFRTQEKLAKSTHTLTANTRDLIYQLLVQSKVPLPPEALAKLVMQRQDSDG